MSISDPRTLVTTTEAAKRLKVAPSTITNWRRDPKCPRPVIERPGLNLWNWVEIRRYGHNRRKQRHARARKRRSLEGVTHGTRSTYVAGCKCQKCRAANTEYHKRYAREKRAKARRHKRRRRSK